MLAGGFRAAVRLLGLAVEVVAGAAVGPWAGGPERGGPPVDEPPPRVEVREGAAGTRRGPRGLPSGSTRTAAPSRRRRSR